MQLPVGNQKIRFRDKIKFNQTQAEIWYDLT